MTQSEYEVLAQSLIGETVHKVEYLEIKSDGYETDFDQGKRLTRWITD